MAGHSQFKNIMHRKGRQDKKRAQHFAKISREIIVAAKLGGPNPESNNRLKLAIQSARQNSMPKDNIERALQKATGNQIGENYEELRYEGFGPGKVAMIIEVLTDNRNRSASDLRSLLQKSGGNLGENNAVTFMFKRIGRVHYQPMAKLNNDKVFEQALLAGADDVESGEFGHYIYCAPEHLHQLQQQLEQHLGMAESAKLTWQPEIFVELTDATIITDLMNLIEQLEELDDVQEVIANYDIADEVLAGLKFS